MTLLQVWSCNIILIYSLKLSKKVWEKKRMPEGRNSNKKVINDLCFP